MVQEAFFGERMNLVYQAYGLKDVLEQTLFSTISLLHHKRPESPLKVVIYTDEKEWFEQFRYPRED